MDEANEVGGDWLNVSQAAARLGVSERTIQRRATAGTLTARKVTGRDGQAWEVWVGAANVPTGAATANDSLSSMEAAPTLPNVGSVPTGAAKGADTSKADAERREADLMAALLAEKDGRINDLQKQLDAANGALEREQTAHSETRRVLAFNLATPTLTAPAPSQDAAPPIPPTSLRQRRRPRPFWAVLIGYKSRD